MWRTLGLTWARRAHMIGGCGLPRVPPPNGLGRDPGRDPGRGGLKILRKTEVLGAPELQNIENPYENQGQGLRNIENPQENQRFLELRSSKTLKILKK